MRIPDGDDTPLTPEVESQPEAIANIDSPFSFVNEMVDFAVNAWEMKSSASVSVQMLIILLNTLGLKYIGNMFPSESES